MNTLQIKSVLLKGTATCPANTQKAINSKSQRTR